MRRSWKPAIAVPIGLLIVGCRVVWVHPEASAEKYETDVAHCKYGLTAVDLNRTIQAGKALPPHNRNWKQCMQLLGWSTETKPRAHRLWDRS